jgi:ABC-type transporter Mla subunit MlaD
MRTRCLLAVVPLLLSGCLTPVTHRLDQANRQVESTNEILARMSVQLETADHRLAELQRLFDETNRKLETIDKRMKVVERAVRRFVPAKPE